MAADTHAEPIERTAPSPEPSDSAVVVVVLDGARWQEVFVGTDPRLASTAGTPAVDAAELMPHLHEVLRDRGTALGAPGRGPPVSASGPNFVSMPGYTEIFTGKRAHACSDNECARPQEPTIVDEVRLQSHEDGDVAIFASWERIERAASRDPSALVVSTGRSLVWGADLLGADPIERDWLQRGAAADPAPGSGDFRPDRFTAALALRYLETLRPRFLFIGLGEPDEYAHQGDYRGYVASLRAADEAIGNLFDVLDRMGPRGNHTSVFITADHGRARDYRFHGRQFPESGRVWLVAAGVDVQARGLTAGWRAHRLADIAPTIRVLLDLPPDTSLSAGAPMDELFAPTGDRSVATR